MKSTEKSNKNNQSSKNVPLRFVCTKIRYLLLLLLLITGISHQLQAQGPPLPPASGHGSTGNEPEGGNAPIEGGIILLLAMGVAWGGWKAYKTIRKNALKKGEILP